MPKAYVMILLAFLFSTFCLVRINHWLKRARSKSTNTVGLYTEPTNYTHHQRIFCLVLTTSDNHRTRALAVNRTWGKRCEGLTFATNSPLERNLNTIFAGVTNQSKRFITHRLFATLRIVYFRYHSLYDWFYIADDDTYAIIENLRHFLRDKDPYSFPKYYGFGYGPTDIQYKGENLTFAHGGAGFILGRTALKRLVEVGYISASKGRCHPLLLTERHDEHADVNIGLCLLKLGIKIETFQDEYGRETFLKENPIHVLNMLQTNRESYEQRWASYRDVIHHPESRYEMLSSHAISFHYMSPGDMYFVDFLLYNLRRGD